MLTSCKRPRCSLFASLCLLLFSVSFNSGAQVFKPLPEAVANNAVARVIVDGEVRILSFMGLGSNKDYSAVHNKAYEWRAQAAAWQPIPNVPSSLPLDGRLASIAVGVGQYAYLFGGYTVAKDHTEISSPDNFRYDSENRRYEAIAPMPVAVDDAVALAYKNRYIYLVSGWHNDGNVNLTQLYDVKRNAWVQASPFPGRAVFGHAGGIVDDTMIICDGVAVEYYPEKRRDFKAEPTCFKGVISAEDPSRIAWTTLNHPTGVARYRMAAAGIAQHAAVVFIGGATNPYNFNGVGYDGVPSVANEDIWVFDLKHERLFQSQSKHASMDHRGLIQVDDNLIRIGGMENPQRVTNRLFIDTLTEIFK